jgi:hypothetical protein
MRRKTNKHYTRKSFSLISERGVAAYNLLKEMNENISALIENHLIFIASKYKTKEEKTISVEDKKRKAEYRSFTLKKGKIGSYQCKDFAEWQDYKEKQLNSIRLENTVEQIITNWGAKNNVRQNC